MSKQKVIKWSKRISFILLVLIGGYLLLLLTYWQIYKPYKWKEQETKELSLYKEGINHPEKATTIANKNILEYSKNIEILNNAAEKGFVDAQVMLAIKLKESGNNDKAAYWYLQAAQKGNAEAQGELGCNYKYGMGVKQDFDKAIYWLRLGAKNRNAKAQWRLGNLYLNGLALYDIDFLHTNYWYNGDGVFISLDGEKYKVKNSYLEDILSNPTKVYFKRNIEKAKYYWRLAANQGLQEAKDALEKIYE